MGKLTTYALLITGLILLFYFTGLLENTGTSTLLNMLLVPQGFNDSTFQDRFTLALEGIAVIGGAILIGTITRNLELAVMGAFTLWLSTLLFDFTRVAMRVYAQNPVIAILIFSPLLFLLFLTLMEWWRGRD